MLGPTSENDPQSTAAGVHPKDKKMAINKIKSHKNRRKIKKMGDRNCEKIFAQKLLSE
jgi:hypothetical protein